MRRLIFLTTLLPLLAASATAQEPAPTATPAAAPASDGNNAPAQNDPNAEPTGNEFVSFIEHINFGELWEENSWINWAVLFGGILAGLALGKMLGHVARRIGDALKKRDREASAELFDDLAGPLSLGLLAAGLFIGLTQLVMDDGLRLFTFKIVNLLLAVAVFWYLFNLISVLEVWVRRWSESSDSELDDMVVPLLRQALRIFVVVIAVLFIAQNILGANVTSWLAGLGIAGLAVSLAAQDSLKNLFGSITIVLDRPFVVGSFVKYSGELGTVERIGFRSTRIRTLGGSVLSVPNSNIVNDPVENIGVRPHIRRVLNVTIPYDTPKDKIAEAQQIIKDICKADGVRDAIHDEDDPDDPDNLPPRVFFSDFNAASLNLVVYYWHRPGDWWAYLDHATRFNQMLFEEFEDAGIEFAFPTQTLLLADDKQRKLNVQVTQGGSQSAS